MAKYLEHLNPYSPGGNTGIDRELRVCTKSYPPRKERRGCPSLPKPSKWVSTNPCRQLDVCPPCNWGLQ